MNNFKGYITSVETSGSMSIITACVNESVYLKAIVVDTPQTVSYMSVGHTVKLFFKEIEVVLGVGEGLKLSIENKIKGSIIAIDRGALLSRIVIDSEIGSMVSVMSTKMIEELGLIERMNVTAMVKLNEIVLAP